jgi:hypothetical protein
LKVIFLTSVGQNAQYWEKFNNVVEAGFAVKNW